MAYVRSGAAVGSLLTVVIVALKLSHIVAWSWWLVLVPLWYVAGYVVLVLVIGAFVFAVKRAVTGR